MPSSVPSETSAVFILIVAYVIFSSASFSAWNSICPPTSESAGLAEFLYSCNTGPLLASASVLTKASCAVLSAVVIVNPPLGMATSKFSSMLIAGEPPTTDPRPITKSSAESSNPM